MKSTRALAATVAVVIAVMAVPATSFAYEETTGYAKPRTSLNDPSGDDYKLPTKTQVFGIQMGGDGTI